MRTTWKKELDRAVNEDDQYPVFGSPHCAAFSPLLHFPVGRRENEELEPPASQIQQHIVEDVKVLPQELVLFRTKSRAWTCPFP